MNQEILTLPETAQYLKVSEKTIHRLINTDSIPCSKVGGQWRFMRTVIDDWLKSSMKVIPQQEYINALHAQKEAITLAGLINPECVFLQLHVSTPRQVLIRLSTSLEKCGAISDAYLFLNQLVEREKLMSTGIGKGIALPHPRQPGLPPVMHSALAIAYCKNSLNFGALDGMKTNLFIVIASNSEPVHLKILSLLTRMIAQNDFLDSIKDFNQPSELIRYIIDQENNILGL